jgi:hypothetical protein
MLQRAKEHTGYSDDLPTLMDAIAGKLKADAPMVVRVKQGRPRKNPLPLPLPGSEPLSRFAEAERAGGLSSLMDAVADRPMVVKPKLGRPRKTPLPGSDPSLIDDLPISMDAVADTTRSDRSEAVKRKPGRPRKTPLHPSDPSLPTAKTDDLPISLEAIAGKRESARPMAAKPKLGRPRKAPLPASESSLLAKKAVQEDLDHRLNITKRAAEQTGNSNDLQTLMEAIAGKREFDRSIAVKPKRGRPRKTPLHASDPSLLSEKAARGDFDHRISEAINHHLLHNQESGGDSGDGIDPAT